MKIFICGQRSFGAAVMKALMADGHEIVGVAPAPPGKRHDKLRVAAMMAKVPIRSNAGAICHDDIPHGTELVISAHSHWYIPDRVIAACKYGGIGFHPSLLPRHRGRDAVRWTVAMGDAVTGASVYWLSDVVDGGDILLQKPVFVDKGWNYHELWEHIFPVGVKLMCQAVKLIANGKAPHEEQDEQFKTWEPSFDPDLKLKRNDLFLLTCGGGKP